MSSLSQSPEVYKYRNPEVITSLNQHYSVHQSKETKNQGSFYHPSYAPKHNLQPQSNNNWYGQSQIQAVYAPISQRNSNTRYKGYESPQIVNYSAPKVEENRYQKLQQPQEQKKYLKSSEYKQQPVVNRFKSYSNDRPYKYNIFSLIDQPWNRWQKGDKCDNLAGNECLATDHHTFSNK